jgi:uridine kinase
VIQAVRRIVAEVTAAPAQAGGTRVLAIDGPSGAGKTSLAAAVRAALGPGPVIHLDDLYPGWDGLAESIPRLVEWVLRPLAEGRPPRYRRYDWGRARYAEWIEVPPAAVLIVEGAGAGSLPAAPYLSLLVWLDSPASNRFERAMARDGESYRPHWQRWAHQEERYFAEHDPRGRADLSLDTQDLGVT